MSLDLKTFLRHKYLFLILLLSSFVSFYQIDRAPLDWDEWVTANIVTGFGFNRNAAYSSCSIYTTEKSSVFSSKDYWQRNVPLNVIKYAMDDTGQALPYYILLHYWVDKVGFSVTSLRLPSALMIILATALFYFWIYDKFSNQRMANIATVLFVFHALVIQTAHFARNYGLTISLLMLLLLLCNRLERRLQENSSTGISRISILIGVVALLLVTTHFFTAIAMAPLLVWLVLRYRTRKKQLREVLIWALFPFVILLLVYLFPLNGIKSMENTLTVVSVVTNEKVAASEYMPLTTFPNLIWALLCRLSTSFGNSTASAFDFKSIINVLLLAFPLFLIGVNFRTATRRFGRDNVLWLLFAFLLYAVICTLIALISDTITIFNARYWLFCLPFSLPLLTACYLSSTQLTTRTMRIICQVCFYVVLSRMGFTLIAYINNTSYSYNASLVKDKRKLGDPIEQQAHELCSQYAPGDTVSYNSWHMAQRINWYLRDYPGMIQKVDTNQQEKIRLLTNKLATNSPL